VKARRNLTRVINAGHIGAFLTGEIGNHLFQFSLRSRCNAMLAELPTLRCCSADTPLSSLSDVSKSRRTVDPYERCVTPKWLTLILGSERPSLASVAHPTARRIWCARIR